MQFTHLGVDRKYISGLCCFPSSSQLVLHLLTSRFNGGFHPSLGKKRRPHQCLSLPAARAAFCVFLKKKKTYMMMMTGFFSFSHVSVSFSAFIRCPRDWRRVGRTDWWGGEDCSDGISFQDGGISLRSLHRSNDDDDEFWDGSGHYLTEHKEAGILERTAQLGPDSRVSLSLLCSVHYLTFHRL